MGMAEILRFRLGCVVARTPRVDSTKGAGKKMRSKPEEGVY